MCSVERVQLCSVALGLPGGIRFRVEGGSSYKFVLSRLYRGPQHFSFIGETALRSGQRLLPSYATTRTYISWADLALPIMLISVLMSSE